MANALIGYSGFVGGTLLKQAPFDALYRSTNIADIGGKQFDLVVCAGAPAKKWVANREPEADLQAVTSLMDQLATIQCKTFILISTVDVFQHPAGVDEATPVDEAALQPYGLHRRMLEQFVAQRFARHLIARLPGLVGPGLRKNVIFDFLNQNNLQAVDSRARFQFYPMVKLWPDLQTALNAGLDLVHLTAEPITVAQAALQGFDLPFDNELAAPVASYDMRSLHAHLFGAAGPYQYSARETMLAIRGYAQSERRTA
jgi:nucleoside-diphosphate-sugar epimerase